MSYQDSAAVDMLEPPVGSSVMESLRADVRIPDVINTKIAGVSMGPKTRGGLSMRQEYLKQIRDTGVKNLKLIREPENKWDSYAIAVYADWGKGNQQIGYIQNRARVCLSCSKEFTRADGDVCSCGGELVREGLASTLAPLLDNGYKYGCRLLQVTGGDSGKNLGCNICIERIL